MQIINLHLSIFLRTSFILQIIAWLILIIKEIPFVMNVGNVAYLFSCISHQSIQIRNKVISIDSSDVSTLTIHFNFLRKKKMIDTTRVLLIINIIILLITMILAWIYFLPIILVRRFYTATNILTGNFCLAGIVYCLYQMIFDVLTGFYVIILSCIVTQYLSTMVNCLVAYSLTMITIDRYFIVIHPNKRLFKTQIWSFISLGLQWFLAVTLPLPHLIFSFQVNIDSVSMTNVMFSFYFQSCLYSNQISFWINIYGLIIVVLFPSIINVALNLIIFSSVYSSTRRIHALRTSVSAAINPTPHHHHHGRDVHLLKHIIFVFILFIGGWTPTYIFLVLDPIKYISSWISLLLRLLPVFSSLINIIDLFIYNQEIRHDLTERLMKLFTVE